MLTVFQLFLHFRNVLLDLTFDKGVLLLKRCRKWVLFLLLVHELKLRFEGFQILRDVAVHLIDHFEVLVHHAVKLRFLAAVLDLAHMGS